jgi:hypothetical protein
MGRERGEAVNDEGRAVELTGALALASPLLLPRCPQHNTQYIDHHQNYHLITDLITCCSTYNRRLFTFYFSISTRYQPDDLESGE